MVALMQPIYFDEVTCVYKAPKDWDAKANGPCDDLPVLRTDDAAISRWLPSYNDLLLLNNGGAIELTIHGGQPAVALRVV
jgi:hypothetical protein